MRRNIFHSTIGLLTMPAILLASAFSAAHAFTLPSFSKDIVPIGLSVKITDTKVTPPVGPTSDTATFEIDTPFTSDDFVDDICPGTGSTLMVGVAPSKTCKTGEATLTPITIPLSQVINIKCESFDFEGTNLNANWTVSTFTPPTTGNNQGVTCINGVCTTSGGGTSIISSGNGDQTIVIQSGPTGQGTPTDELSFKATSTTPGVISVPQSKVDVFILYTADNDSDDSGSGNAYEGSCVTLNSTSINSQSKNVNGTKTVTRSFAAH